MKWGGEFLLRTGAGLVCSLGLIAPTVADAAVASIVQGQVKLIRHSERLALAEGNALGDGDIVETAPGAFVQIEFDDRSSVNLGGATRVLLGPRMPRVKTRGPVQFYLLQGWVKATPKRDGAAVPSSEVPIRFVGPRLEVESRGGAVIAQFDPKAVALFCERGSCRGTLRDAAATPIDLAAGDFAGLPAGAAGPVMAKRPDPAFLEELPKLFRDTLPLRAALFAPPLPRPRPEAAVGYADVGHWLQAEGAIRPPLVAQWRGRASDADFRNELVAHLKQHPEWERILFPERFLPKPSPTPVAANPPAPERSGASP